MKVDGYLLFPYILGHACHHLILLDLRVIMKCYSDFFLSATHPFTVEKTCRWLKQRFAAEGCASAAQVNYNEEELKRKLISTLSLSEFPAVIKDMTSLACSMQEHFHGFSIKYTHSHRHTLMVCASGSLVTNVQQSSFISIANVATEWAANWKTNSFI